MQQANDDTSGVNRMRRPREVAAMVTFSLIPKMRRDFSGSSPSPAQQLIARVERTGLLVERPWYGLDSFTPDLRLAQSQKKPGLTDIRAAEEFFRNLQENPVNIAQTLDAERISDEKVRAAMKEPAAAFIHLDLTGEDNPVEAIKIHVPFLRLKRFLVRAYQKVERSGSAEMTQVRIAHAPRLDNANARVKALLNLPELQPEV